MSPPYKKTGYSLVKRILARHDASLKGRLLHRTIRSASLGIDKPFYLYLPPGYDMEMPLPVLYLFRGHEREWVNIREDHSRKFHTAIEDLDLLIARGDLPPLLAVMPGLASANNHVPSLGINMAGTWKPMMRGLGSGRFWDYLTGELIPYIDRKFPQTAGTPRLAAGFSIGGYTVSLLATRMPGYFDYAAMYDGLFMWPGHVDPRVDGGKPDRIWHAMQIFNPALGAPRDRQAMDEWNTTDLLMQAPPETLALIRRTSFVIHSANSDGRRGNKDRCVFFDGLLRERAMTVLNDRIVYQDDARHQWYWNDLFLVDFLRMAFRGDAGAAKVATPEAAEARTQDWT